MTLKLSGNCPTFYRPDIDGLRGISIIAVILFHAFPSYVPGGFIGVDVFFVISGFLITGIILKNLRRNCFSFRDFWARRIRRLLPALLTVILFVFTLGWLYLLPAEFKILKSHIMWGLGFSANFKLNSEIGYFDSSSELKPLLHLWSLAIEEQFYFIWPGILWICWKRKINLFVMAFLFASLSYFSSKIAPLDSSSSFYMPWTRFWELQIGALIAIYLAEYHQNFIGVKKNNTVKFFKPLRKKNRLYLNGIKNLLAFAGLTLIIISCFAFNKSTPFPSKFTLVPVLGTVLLIFAGDQSWLNKRVIAFRPLLFMGLISYPLYLWHWPLFSFVRIIYGNPNFKVMLLLVVFSLILAILTFQFIEKNLRYERSITTSNRFFFQKKALTLFTVNVTLVLIFAGFSNSIIPRASGLTVDLLSKEAFTPNSGTYCKEHFPVELCQISAENKPPTVALLGDSHANYLFPGLNEKLSGENLLLIAKSGTLPFYKISSLRNTPSNLTIELDKIIHIPTITTVILAGFWGNYAETKGIIVADL